MDPTSNDGDGYGGSNGEEGGDRRRGFSGKQQMRGTPPLLQKYNRFSCLEVEEYEDTSDQEEPAVPKSEERMEVKMKKWEKKLPSAYVLAATPGSNSFKLRVEIQTTDTQEIKAAMALLDCGASRLFVHRRFVEKERLNMRSLTNPIQVRNVDGTSNEAGPITEVLNLILRYQGHSERATFAVTSIGDQDLILGLPWLRQHNPEVNWQTEEVKMSRCPERCQKCRKEMKEERKVQKAMEKMIRQCKEGQMTEIDPEMEDLPELCPDPDDEEEEEEVEEVTKDEETIEEGDRVFMMRIGEEEEIQATENFSQRLAQAFQQYTTPKDFRDAVPNYLHDFKSVFSKESFDTLPEQKPLDNAIELVPNAEVGNCKIYPLSRDEQKELDEFLKENLNSGRIRPSKSPMAAPCFFVKKKDGKLHLVQDYRKLNAITVKNRYPLPLISELIGKLCGARYFTKLDIQWGYNNVRIKKGDEWKADRKST